MLKTLTFMVADTTPQWGNESNPGWPNNSPVKTATGFKLVDLILDDQNATASNVLVKPTSISAYEFANNLDDWGGGIVAAARTARVDLPSTGGSSSQVLSGLKSVMASEIAANPSDRIVINFSGHGNQTIFFQGALTLPDSVKLLTYVKSIANGAELVLDLSTNCNDAFFDFLRFYGDAADFILTSEEESGGYSIDNATIDQWLAVRNTTQYASIWGSDQTTRQAIAKMAANLTTVWNLEKTNLLAAGTNGQQSFSAFDMDQLRDLLAALGAVPAADFAKMTGSGDIASYINSSGDAALKTALADFLVNYVDTRSIVSFSNSWAGLGSLSSSALQVAAKAAAGGYSSGSSVSAALAANAVNAVTPAVIFDTAANLTLGLDRLEALYEAKSPINTLANLSVIVLADPGAELRLSETQLIDDSYVLSQVYSDYRIRVSDVAAAHAAGVATIGHVSSLAIRDTSAQVGANLDRLAKLADVGKLATIDLTDSATPVLAIGKAQWANDAHALDLVASAYTLRITDLGAAGQSLVTAFTTLLRAAPTDAFATRAAITLTNGASIANAMHVDAATLSDLIVRADAGTITLSAALTQVAAMAQATTSVATLTYEFFTGKIPSQLGIDYLVSPTGPNPTGNINGPLYNYFNTVNRYINFAVALGKNGEAKDSFAAEYGSLSLFEATRHAYAEIFGGTPTDAKVHQLLDTRVDFLAGVGGDGPEGIGTKAAMVGFLLAAAATENVGVMAKANEAWLIDLADGSAPFAINILDPAKGYYKADYVFGG